MRHARALTNYNEPSVVPALKNVEFNVSLEQYVVLNAIIFEIFSQ